MASGGIVPLFNILSGAVALLVSYYAYKNNRLIGSPLLKYISIGFLLLGLGLILEAGTETIGGLSLVDAIGLRELGVLEFLISTALQLIAYAIFAWGYGLSAIRKNEGAQSPIPAAIAPALLAVLPRRLIDFVMLILGIFLASQVGIIALLFFIVYQGLMVFSRTKSNLSLMVLFGFTLIFIGHLLLFFSAIYLSAVVLLIGDTIQFCGFLSLLFFLFWSGRVVR